MTMKTISLRRFRDTVSEIDIPVEVSRRDPEGNIQILGYWTPYMQHVEGSVPLPPMVREAREPDAGAAVPAPVRAFPKSMQTGKKK